MSNFIDQEQEHWDHVWGSASEAQNCLSEAILHAAANTQVRHIGYGRYIIRTTCAVFCRATDAFAGTVTVEIRRFHTAQAGRDWLDEVSIDRDEYEHHLFEGQYIDDARAAAAAYQAAEDDSIPF